MTHVTIFSVLLALVLEAGCGARRSNPEESGTVVREPASGDGEVSPTVIGGHTPEQILTLFGYKGFAAVTDRQVANYQRIFGFLDSDRDGRHSRKEFIEDGAYMNRQARQGIFQASDSNRDGFVSEAEYVENRVITDEAKEIFFEMDANGDSRLTAGEIVTSGKFANEELARKVFEALDTNGNGELLIPEYLRVWGRWARS